MSWMHPGHLQAKIHSKRVWIYLLCNIDSKEICIDQQQLSTQDIAYRRSKHCHCVVGAFGRKKENTELLKLQLQNHIENFIWHQIGNWHSIRSILLHYKGSWQLCTVCVHTNPRTYVNMFQLIKQLTYLGGIDRKKALFQYQVRHIKLSTNRKRKPISRPVARQISFCLCLQMSYFLLSSRFSIILTGNQ